MMSAAIEQFASAIKAAGITPPDEIRTDGELHRFASNGKHHDDAGWYVYHADGIAAGAFGNWRSGESHTWRANIGRKLSPVEAAALSERAKQDKHKRDTEEARGHACAAKAAAKLLAAADQAPDGHPYLAGKGIAPLGVKVHRGNRVIGGMNCDGALMVPMRDVDGVTQSIQFIAPDGEKRFLPGGRKRGLYCGIKGNVDGGVLLCEGFATGASLFEATGQSTLVAFDAGNLKAVAVAIRAKYPELRIIVCSDDDLHTAGNPGITKATEAARAVGGFVAIPEFGEDRPEGATDFNDMMAHRGAEAVKQAIANAKAPDVSTREPAAADATVAESGLRVLTLGELVRYEFAEREAILEPWLLTQSLSMIHSWRGTGKTHVALGIAYAVATGGKFLTWEAKKPRRVLYVDGEMPGAALQKRLIGLIESDERDFDPTYLCIVTPDAQGDGIMPDLATADGQTAIEAAGADAELIILDNISTLCRGAGPENDAESWRGPQEWALRMRRAGKAVLFIHHSGKGGGQRGSSKREDTLDVVINLRRPPDYSDEQGARFELRYEKYRNAAGDEAKPIEAMLATDADGHASWSWRSVEESTFDQVVSLANDGLRPGEIAHELGIHKSRVSRHLKRARELGKVKVGGHGE